MKKILVSVLVLVMCITAFVACNPTDDTTPDLSGLNSAKAYLQNQYREAATNTLGDFERLATLKVGTATFTVEWTASVTSGPQTITVVDNEDGTVTIDIEEVDETVTEDTLYTLTATITDANGNSTTLTYNHMIPKFAVNTFAEYVAAEAGESIVIDGIVTGILPKGNGATNDGFYMNTLDGGGVYVYQTSGAELTVGQTIRVKGTKDIYSGTHELKDSTYEVLDANVTTVTPVDYTEIYTNAEDVKDEALVEKQALLVTIKGVTIGTVGGSDGSYYYFELAGKSTYIRISGSSCPMTTAEQTAFIDAFKASLGATADVTGLITVYNGAFYLTPVSANAISNIVAPELTDQQVVDGAKEALTIVDTIKEAGTVELPTAGTGIYSDATVTWALAETTLATLEGNVLTVAELPEDESTITLTATIAKGDATPATKEFTVTVKSAVIDWKDATFAVTEAGKLDGASKETSKEEYYFYGTVGTAPTADYCNFDLTDGTNSILVYGLYAADGENRYGTSRDIAEIPFKQGDLICLRGYLQNYNGTLEIKNAVLVETPAQGTAICNPYTAKEAVEEAGKLDAASKETSTEEYFFYGTVGTAPSADYCNFDLTDGTNSILVYGLYAVDGENRYGTSRDIAEIPFKQGDLICLRGYLQNYNGTLEIKNAVLISFSTPAGSDTPDTPDTPAGPNTTHAGTEADPYSVADALTVAGALESGAYSGKVYVTGTIKSIGSVGSYLKNVYIVDTTDATKEILVYSVNFTTDVPAAYVNDTVTIHGYITNYNGTLEISSNAGDYANFVAYTAGTSTITSTGANATVTLSATSGVNGTTFTFTVEAAQGYDVASVKVNGTAVTAVEGTYTGTIAGNTIVAVETVEAGAPVSASLGKVTFGETTNSGGVGSYVNTWTATENGITLNLENFNNNNNGWAYIKCGRKSDASVATISAGAMTQVVTKVVVTIDSVLDTSKVNSFKLVVSTDADFTNIVEEIDGTLATGDATFTITTPAAGLYYKVVFDCSAHGSKNGIVQVSAVEFFGYNA